MQSPSFVYGIGRWTILEVHAWWITQAEHEANIWWSSQNSKCNPKLHQQKYSISIKRNHYSSLFTITLCLLVHFSKDNENMEHVQKQATKAKNPEEKKLMKYYWWCWPYLILVRHDSFLQYFSDAKLFTLDSEGSVWNNGFTRKEILVVHQEPLPNSKAHSIMGQTIREVMDSPWLKSLKERLNGCLSTLVGINILQGPFYAMILGNTKKILYEFLQHWQRQFYGVVKAMN